MADGRRSRLWAWEAMGSKARLWHVTVSPHLLSVSGRRHPPFPSFLCSSQESSHAKSFAWKGPPASRTRRCWIPVASTGVRKGWVGVAPETLEVTAAEPSGWMPRRRRWKLPQRRRWAGVAAETLGDRCDEGVGQLPRRKRPLPRPRQKYLHRRRPHCAVDLREASDVGDGAHPRFPHSCACHRDPVTRSLSRGRALPRRGRDAAGFL
jgi:hypothetical protein